MKINIKLDPDFSYEFTKLKSKYGEDIAKLNGLADSQLDYTDFIDNFIDKKVVADASIDPNANVGHKDVVTLEHEMSKPHYKLLALNKIYYEMKKQFGKEDADKWLQLEYSRGLYLHDAPTSSTKSYCIYPTECCEFIYEGKKIYASLEQMYNLVKESELTDELILYKIPKNLLVADYDTNRKKFRYTKVNCISKKPVDKDLYYIRALNNFDIITTEDHKIITTKKDKKAKELLKEDLIYSIYNNNLFDNSIYEYNGLDLTKELGWLIGIYLAEGYNSRGQLCICQDEEKSSDIYNKIVRVCDNIGIPYNLNVKNRIQLKNGNNNWERKMLTIIQGKYSYSKCLCPDFIHFNEDFLKGFIGGIVDGDGTIGNNNHCMIRMASRTLINQIKAIGMHFGVYFGGNTPYLSTREKSFTQRRAIYSASANMNQNKDFFLEMNSTKINEKFTNFSYNAEYNTSCIFEQGEIPIKMSEQTYQYYEEVYDLSTDSHTFMCNNILVHNCYAYTLKDLAEKGLYFIEGYNAEPAQHLGTFVTFLKEFISYTSNRTSGACGLPNLIPYMYYFWSRDVKQGYYTETPEKYAKQNIQSFIYAIELIGGNTSFPFINGVINKLIANGEVIINNPVGL